MKVIRHAPGRLRPAKKALLIGIGYSKNTADWPPLPGITSEVTKLRDLLIERFGYRAEDVVMMSDEEGVATRLQPTKVNILREIRALVSEACAGDHLVFYFAGHGVPVPNKSGTEDDNQDETILSADIKKIKDNKLRKLLVKPLPKGVKLTAIFDSCYSGTLLDLEHYTCNSVYVPWVNKGDRKSNKMQSRITRQNAISHAGSGDLTFDMSPSFPPSFPKRGLRRSQSSYSTVARERALPYQSALLDVNVQTFHTSQPLGEILAPNTVAGTLLFSTISVSTCTSSLSHTENENFSPVPLSAIWRSVIDGVERAMSPVSFVARMCEGYCRDHPKNEDENLPQASVVSISASKDAQLSWGENGSSSMTLSLIKIIGTADLRYRTPSETHAHNIEENQELTYHSLMTLLNHRMHESTMQMHEYFRNLRSEGHKDEEAEMNNFQEPQLGSLRPLNMDEVFTL